MPRWTSTFIWLSEIFLVPMIELRTLVASIESERTAPTVAGVITASSLITECTPTLLTAVSWAFCLSAAVSTSPVRSTLPS